MPHFCDECGQDTFICQKCGKVFCTNESCSKGTKYHWDTKVTGSSSAGAVCDNCYIEYWTRDK